MSKDIDILSFNSVAIADEGGELELFYAGKTTGIFLKVLGAHSNQVQEHELSALKDYARKQKYAEKKGNEAEFQLALIDRLQQRSIDNAAVRVVGWRGANGDYDEAKLKTALKNNPEWIEEIMQFSADLGK